MFTAQMQLLLYEYVAYLTVRAWKYSTGERKVQVCEQHCILRVEISM